MGISGLGRLRRRPAVCALLGVCLLLVPAACMPGQGHAPATLRVATGVTGGVYVPYGEGLVRDIKRDVSWIDPKIVRTDGSVANLKLLAAGEAEVAFTASDIADDAVNGREGFSGSPQKLTALARLYDDYVQLVTLVDGPVDNLADLAGKRVSVGRPGSGTAVLARRIMDVVALHTVATTTAAKAGEDAEEVRTQSLDVYESVVALEAGRIDAFFWSGGLPTEAIANLRNRKAIALIDLGEVANLLAVRFGDFYTSSKIPAATYELPDSVRTIAVPNYLVAAPGVDGDLVEAVTRVLFAGGPERVVRVAAAAQLDIRSALSTYPLELHPGAVAYYRKVHG